MSHFTCIQTKICNQEALVGALQELGYSPEVGQDIRLYGYQGDLRPDTADVVVRRRELSPSSNDLGFARVDDGTYQAIISEYDVHQSPDLVSKVVRCYAERIIRENVTRQGFAVVDREVMRDGSVKLRLERWS